MLINEIFYSIQGEGPNTGRLSVFIRLAGCNLRCIWCDTKYTWLFSDKTLKNLKLITPKEKYLKLGDQIYNKEDEINSFTNLELIDKIKNFPTKNIVITGGEPLLQKIELIILIKDLKKLNYNIEIETNGTIFPDGIPNYVHFNVSPKLSNSYNSEARRINHNVLKEFIKRGSILKFVVSNENDISEILHILSKLNFTHNQVYLMPEASTKENLNLNSINVLKLCKKYGYNYSHRLHIELFNNKRGV